MPSRGRRSLPDNLDPLVDTLSNVVGILVIVVVLSQIQLGDALTRVAELDLLRLREERVRASVPVEVEALDLRRNEIVRRTDADVAEAIELARETLATLEALPTRDESPDDRSLEALDEALVASRREIEARLATKEQRERYAERLREVPKQLVARLPDPVVVQGKEAWIFVRHGRIYLADREKLLEQGSRAIDRILVGGGSRQLRHDEFESVSRYLRKRAVGAGNFRWALKTDPAVRAELVWRTENGGIEHADLARDRSFRRWLAERDPEIDFIRFHVWADSFEAYLAAREVVEAAGFRAGWYGHEKDDDFELTIRFGPAQAPIGPIEVD